MDKPRNEELNKVLMTRRSVIFKDKKHPTRQELKKRLRDEWRNENA